MKPSPPFDSLLVMDVLSCMASIIAIISATQAGVKGLRKLQSLHRSPREVGELLGEMKDFGALLEKIKEFLQQNHHVQYASLLESPAKHGGDIVDQINSILASPSCKLLKWSRANQERIIWAQQNKKLKSLQKGLRHIRIELIFAYTILTASLVTRFEDLMTNLIQSQDQNFLQLSSILQRMSIVEERACILEAPNGGIIPSASDNIATMSEPDSVTTESSAGSSSSVALNPAMALSPLTQDLFAAREEGNSFSDYYWRISRPRHKCIDWCSCICHRQRSFRSPWKLKSIFGHLLVEYVSKGAECSEHSCRRQGASSSSINMTYHLPQYLMSRYISAIIQYTPVDGPKASLRAPRIMDWSHLLFKYASIGDIEAIQNLFLAKQASPDDVNQYGGNALIYAACHGHSKLGRFLVNIGTDAELVDVHGRKPIDLFWERAFSGQLGEEDYHTIKLTFEDTDYVENRHFSVIHKIVLGLVDKDLRSELIHSTAMINTVDAQGRTALCWAAIRDDSSSIAVLLDFGADPNISDNEDNTCLHFARSASTCQSLLNHNVNVHARNRPYSRSPLHSLCERTGRVDMIECLVEKGIGIDDRDADGETPLLNAIFRRFSSAAQKLIELGANVNTANYSSGDAAIHFAVEHDHHEVLALLLKNGANYAATNLRGRTIAHLAARSARPKTIAILSQAKLAKLDLSIRDENGKTAADYLAERRILSKTETGVHAAFEKLVQSIYADRSALNDISITSEIDSLDANDIEEQRDSEHYCRPPGAYPTTREA